MQTQLESLQNWANRFGFTAVEYFQQDKRKTVQMYFLIDSKYITISPVYDYENLCTFMNGYGKAIERVICNIMPNDMDFKRK